MDIKPPPKKRKKTPIIPKLPSVETPLPVPIASSTKWTRKQWRTFALAGTALLLLAATISVGLWYQWATEPRSAQASQVRVIVEPGETVTSISDTLHDHELIRSRLAFHIYVQLSGQRTKLQAGGYVLSPNQDIPSIVEHMTTGSTDEFDITIPPGLTLDKLREHFAKDGFSDEEISSAFAASYTHPLLADRPAGATLEGYIYPETYKMNANQPLQALFERSFDQLYTTLQEKKYLEEFTKRNLTLHQALTMASIIQMEVSDPTDQRQVAQVFHKRLAGGIKLQSDPTFIYPARKAGARPHVDFDSPYNTYRNLGLPPGPIANFNLSAAEAVAQPAPGDFLYFVADRAGTTHFSKTLEEHERKVQRFCTDHCTDF